MARRKQLELPQTGGWGGHRKGAGRKPKGAEAMVSHDTRPEHSAAFPVHVTMRAVDGLPSLRGRRLYDVVEDAIARAQRETFRIVEFAVLGNHVHYIVEGDDRLLLIRGIHGMAVRMAKAVNKALHRRGKVWGDRYFARWLTSPAEVKTCIRYVVMNGRKHFDLPPGPDPCSSGPWSSCWAEEPSRPVGRCPVVPAKSWLLRVGWRKHGLIAFTDRPAA